MSDTDWTMDSGEEDIDEQGRNPTQQRLDEESSPPEVENEPSPHQGEEGTEPVYRLSPRFTVVVGHYRRRWPRGELASLKALLLKEADEVARDMAEAQNEQDQELA